MEGIVFGCIVPHPPLIIPGIGQDSDKRLVINTINAMYNLAEYLKSSNPETVIIISPHNYYTNSSYMTVSISVTSQGNLFEWGATVPELKFNNDLQLAQEIINEAKALNISVKPIGIINYNLDHGTLVPLYFLEKAIKNLALIPISFSYQTLETHYEFGKAITKAAVKLNRKIAIIASGDLSHYLKGSHYGYHPEGESFEQQLHAALESFDPQRVLNIDKEIIEKAGECGLRSIVILLGALDNLKVQSKILSHEGPFGVGYMVAYFKIIN